MPRTARRASRSGYLHIIMRGISRQALFECPGDYRQYLSVLRKYAEETQVTICAYCLMENHIHLLVRDKQNKIALLIKKIGVSYSQYYNKKYDRCGHLFQDRYLSEVIDNESYLFSAFRYILNNPAKAGIYPASAYEWSSCRLYGTADSFVDASPFLQRISGMAELKTFISGSDRETECLEYYGKRTDEWARERICQLLDADSGMILQKLPRKERNASLRKLKQAGLSIRQIERLTGIGRNIIQRA